MREFLTTFSGFRTRYYKSASGRESSKWLLDHLSFIATGADTNKVVVTVESFAHSWGQSSVIARITPFKDHEKSKNGGVVIISAHQDSVNQWNPWFGRSPGADDDGSGSTTIIEAFRILVKSGYTPSKTLEFHWYSAEEGGLLGSQKVAAYYHAQEVNVLGAFQVDMTGYLPPGKPPVIGIATDNTSNEASAFLRVLADNYCGIPWVNTKCGYGCSDHASWHQLGYPAVFTFESDFNDHSPYIHTSDDTVEHISFEHIAEFVKLVLAWGVEMTA